VDANRTQRWPTSSLHTSCDHKMLFVILGKIEIELAPNSRIRASLSKINTKETYLSERTARFGTIFKLMIFTMGSFGYTLCTYVHITNQRAVHMLKCLVLVAIGLCPCVAAAAVIEDLSSSATLIADSSSFSSAAVVDAKGRFLYPSGNMGLCVAGPGTPKVCSYEREGPYDRFLGYTPSRGYALWSNRTGVFSVSTTTFERRLLVPGVLYPAAQTKNSSPADTCGETLSCSSDIVSPDGAMAVVVNNTSSGGNVWVNSLVDGTSAVSLLYNSSVGSLMLLYVGNSVVVFCNDDNRSYNLLVSFYQSARTVKVFSAVADSVFRGVPVAVLLPNERGLVFQNGTTDSSIRFFDFQTGNTRIVFSGVQSFVPWLAVTPDSKSAVFDDGPIVRRVYLDGSLPPLSFATGFQTRKLYFNQDSTMYLFGGPNKQQSLFYVDQQVGKVALPGTVIVGGNFPLVTADRKKVVILTNETAWVVPVAAGVPVGSAIQLPSRDMRMISLDSSYTMWTAHNETGFFFVYTVDLDSGDTVALENVSIKTGPSSRVFPVARDLFYWVQNSNQTTLQLFANTRTAANI
jgi:hypothetical protein